MIAEIVALPLYESQVTDLLTEDERSAMEYYIALAPEAHPVIPALAKLSSQIKQTLRKQH